jgi:hypothetical protein
MPPLESVQVPLIIIARLAIDSRDFLVLRLQVNKFCLQVEKVSRGGFPKLTEYWIVFRYHELRQLIVSHCEERFLFECYSKLLRVPLYVPLKRIVLKEVEMMVKTLEDRPAHSPPTN